MVNTFLPLLHAAVSKCTAENLGKARAWATRNISPHTKRVEALITYMVTYAIELGNFKGAGSSEGQFGSRDPSSLRIRKTDMFNQERIHFDCQSKSASWRYFCLSTTCWLILMAIHPTIYLSSKAFALAFLISSVRYARMSTRRMKITWLLTLCFSELFNTGTTGSISTAPISSS